MIFIIFISLIIQFASNETINVPKVDVPFSNELSNKPSAVGTLFVMEKYIGNVYGRLTIISLSHKKNGLPYYNCTCSCGTSKVILIYDIVKGKTKSCGCLHDEMVVSRNTKHNNSIRNKLTPEYKSWASARSRCVNINNAAYQKYGGRGIKMCDEWLNDFSKFLSDMGPRPIGYSLDRINNDGGYNPINCRWASRREQNNNQSNTVFITYKELTKPLSYWADDLGINIRILYERLFRYKWSVEKSFTHPIRITNRNISKIK